SAPGSGGPKIWRGAGSSSGDSPRRWRRGPAKRPMRAGGALSSARAPGRNRDDQEGPRPHNHGKINTMKTTIDAAGRLVIPKEIRREAGLKPGVLLEVRCHEGRIEIEPAPLPVKLVQRGRLLVAIPTTEGEQLTAETVERTREMLLDERLPDA